MNPIPSKRSLRAIPAALALAAAVLVAPSAPTQAAPDAHAASSVAGQPSRVAASRYLDVSGQAQQQDNWCWAATGNSVASYFGYGQYSQNQFCNMAFGYSLNSSCPNDQATLGNDQRAFRAIGISAGSYISNTISFSTLTSEINANRPVMTRIGWSSGGGHMMVLTGYDTSGSTVEYYDPWPDNSRWNTSTYSWYVSNSSFDWTHTLYKIGA
ncbi:papain-like cysteine protease family protein [Nocardioides sp. LML1-1-1.1]|uniref:papain-like cysteine protease family protein n=1 Tax=Nocardioides sp. LML1-1-1.1 TaxID=3135248 RepID=UPI0034479E0C